jgi:hypothetical protein
MLRVTAFSKQARYKERKKKEEEWREKCKNEGEGEGVPSVVVKKLHVIFDESSQLTCNGASLRMVKVAACRSPLATALVSSTSSLGK